MQAASLASLNEEALFNLIKEKLIPDLEHTDEFHYSDCTSEERNLIIELKCRRTHYEELMIEQSKYIKLLTSDYWEVRYINSTPLGIYSFDLRAIEEPEWFMKNCKKTTDFENNEYIPKMVGMLSIHESKDITNILL